MSTMGTADEPKPPALLVVDDDPVSRTALARTLAEGFPHAVLYQAWDGESGFEIAVKNGVDLVLSDMVMPGLDGLGLLRRLREDPRTGSAYVILVTGLTPEEQLLLAVDESADDCLIKPWRREELIARVRAGLRRVGQLRELERKTHHLEQFSARQSEFLSWVSHEIRTPMSAILSSANILLRYGEKRPESVARFAGVIHEEGRRLTRLINNLLDLAKIEAGEVEWRFAPTPVSDLLELVRESFTALAGERSVALRVTSEAAPATVVVDRDKVTQVLANLVSNALKHSPDGGEIQLRCARCGVRGVRVEVEDDGPGIPSGLEERVFERFQQLEEGEERTGTGLGLTIAREIVVRHGGRIWAEKGHAPGALFVVELPGEVGSESDDGSV